MMRLNRKVYKFFILCIAIFFMSCSSFAKSIAPYSIKVKMSLEENSEYEIAGLHFDFYNKAPKTIKNFTLVFYLYDQDGEPVCFGRNNFVVTIDYEIEGGKYVEGCLSLDKYLSEIPEEEYQVDFVYVSKIVYEDESIWTDPFGFMAG